MQLKIASHKAIKYSCLNFHYAKAIPATKIAYNVFNKNKEWCGCITFGSGANYKLGFQYGLVNGQFLELTRMALNGKQESTSKAMSIAIKLIKKNFPLVKLLISYADKGQNHKGIIYQATNWIFVDETKTSGWEIFYKGKWRHDRIKSHISKSILKKIPKRKKSGKYKYLYPLNNKIKKEILKLKKPYPKNATEV
tara:strand:- start:1292 stop:1876 length:585 start_codon:yes stop_codon:yes gene_type:complete